MNMKKQIIRSGCNPNGTKWRITSTSGFEVLEVYDSHLGQWRIGAAPRL